jgi:hypothetical protein
VSRLALTLLSLPFSNATVERLFSLMNIVHSKLRNRLHVRTTEAILQIRYSLKRQNCTCATFEPSEHMLQHFFDKGPQSDDGDDFDAGALLAGASVGEC